SAKKVRESRVIHCSVVEQAAQSNGEHIAAIEGMLQGGNQERTCVLVAPRKKQAASQREYYRPGIAEDNVRKSKGCGAAQNHGCNRREQAAIALKHECPINDSLRVDRKNGIQQHHKSPQERARPHERKKGLPLPHPNTERDQSCGDNKNQQHATQRTQQGS